MDKGFFGSSARVRDRRGSITRVELDGRVRRDALCRGEVTVEFAVRVRDLGNDTLWEGVRTI